MSARTYIRIMQLTLLIIATLIASVGDGISQIYNTPNIDQLCRSAPALTSRKTVVYVDIASVRKGNPQWGLTILNKLELVSRESLTVVSVNPTTFEAKEEFDTCYPKLSESEIAEARKSRSILDKLFSLDPADQQRENLQTFTARLGNALNRIEGDSEKYKEGGRRNILGAISVDKNRYSDRAAFYRIIIYTDGIIKEPTADDKKPETTQTSADKYLASFSGAEVAVFGIDSQDATIQSKEKIFTAFFLKSWALLRSFSPSLPQQENFVFPPAMRMDGTFDGGGTQGSLRLALFSAKQADVANGWLAFNVGRETLYVPFRGEYRCEGENCRLSAVCSESVPPHTPTPYFRKGDKILLSGKAGRSLEGSLQADAKEIFIADGKQTVKYELKFSSR